MSTDDRPGAVESDERIECYVCGEVAVIVHEDGLLRYPIGWERDKRSQWRCPKDRVTGSTLATFGDMFKIKESKRNGKSRARSRS